jgi:cobalamin biosynthesis Mg chelatase CobN
MAAGRLATLLGTPIAPASTVYRYPTSHRTLRLGLALMAFVMLSAIASGAAMAKTKPCAKQVVADWYDDGRVGKIYPLDCYRQAIASLPSDVLDYSNAKEEIGRALAFAKQGKPDPGGEDPTPPTTSTGTPATDTSSTDASSGVATVNGPGGPREVTTDQPQTDAVTQTATQTTDTSGPSSVPIPLLVLGGLAVVLLAAGSAGYLRRRLGGGGDDGTPPASA